MIKRIFLFVLTNILVIATITIILNLFGLDKYFAGSAGGGYGPLLLFCTIWGFGGAFISLAMSKFTAKMFMRVQVIDPQAAMGVEGELVRTVHRLAQAAGLNKMPEVGIYNSPEVNAFATGPSKNNSLVAVSTGLLQRMNKDELEGVLGHEVAHIANGDMVTMTLLQGVINVFVMFFARVLAFAVSNALSRDEEGRNHMLEFGLIMLFQIVFGLLGMIVVNAFSRYREFRADAGGAQFAGRRKMIAALENLRNTTQLLETEKQASFDTLKISGKSALAAIFSTHPDLTTRIERLKMAV